MDTIADRRRALLEELRTLDTQHHPMQAEQRRGEILEALRLERRGVEARVRQVAYLSDDDKVQLPLLEPHQWPTAALHRARLAEQADAIDAEIARLEAQAA